jgi:glycosyltransferase involved in cell wall biosynthesis
MTGTSPGSVATRRSLKLRLAYRTIARFCPPDRFIAITKEIAHFYRGDCAIPPGRIVHIPHGIDLSFFRTPSGDERTRARRTYDLADDALVCILPGRLNFDKGHDVTIDAVRMLRASRPDLSVVCLFPGGGDQGEAIRAYAHRDDADVRTFRFLGFIEPGAFRAAYWAADIGLLPSRFEGFGQVIAEAMSCGCVPIRTPSGGWEDQIVDRVNGYVIPFNDAAALAGRIAALADPVERAAMRERALTFAAGHFDQAAMVAATAAAYDAVTIPHRTRAAC